MSTDFPDAAGSSKTLAAGLAVSPVSAPGTQQFAGFVEPLRQLKATDWFFVGCAWLTAAWAFYIGNDTFGGNDAVGFDFLPVAAGLPTVLAGWRATRIKVTIDAAVDGLLNGAGLDLKGDIDAFEAALKRRVKFWSRATGLAIAVCFVGYLVWAFNKFDPAGPGFVVLLFAVCIGIGFQIGRMLGSMLGYGQILSVMRDAGVAIGSIDTEQARRAIGRIEEILNYFFWLTTAMCHWFAIWFVAWFLGFDDDRYYRAYYSWLFIALWAVSFALYLFSARAPILAFRARLTDLHGGTEGEAARRRQLAEAQEDLKRLSDSDDSDRRAERIELQAVVDELKKRNAPPRLPRPWLVNVLAVWIALLFAVSVGGTILNITPETARYE
jgi:hypothetical protein